ncbi:MAG: hypothetical protein AAF664_06440 [Planctomycetota bacterium]
MSARDPVSPDAFENLAIPGKGWVGVLGPTLFVCIGVYKTQ